MRRTTLPLDRRLRPADFDEQPTTIALPRKPALVRSRRVLEDPLSLVGATLHGGYRVEELVSHGGLSLVYRATDRATGETVALKCYDGLADLPEPAGSLFRDRFARVGSVIAELAREHDGLTRFVAQGYVVLKGREVPCLLLDWLEGVTLETLLDSEREQGLVTRSSSEVLDLMRKPMEALAAAHDAGIVHRDLKPSNIYVCGERLEYDVPVKVLDFLLAKCEDEGSQGQAVSFMTPDYAAPEQFLGVEALIGPWTDVFSLALILVEMMLGGRAALPGDDFDSLKRASLDARRRPTPGSFGLDVPNAVESVFKRALAVDVRNRFENAGRFLTALQRAVEAHGRLTSTGLSRVSGSLLHDPDTELKRTRRSKQDSTGARHRSRTGETVVSPGPVQTGHTVIARAPTRDED